MKIGFPLPDLDFAPTRGFWEAAQRGQLVIPCCEDCGSFNWYPTQTCNACSGRTMPWTAVSGSATLFSYTLVSRALFKAYAARAPYLTGLVALDEDPRVRLVTLLVDCTSDELRLDMPMNVVFRTLEFPEVAGKVLAPMFTPAQSADGNPSPSF